MDRFLELYSRLTHLHKLLISAGILIVILYLGYEAEVVTAEQELQAAKDAAIAQEADVAKMRELNLSAAGLEEERRRAEEENSELKKRLPSEPQIEELLASISESAKATGITIVDFEPKNEEVAPAPVTSPIPAQKTTGAGTAATTQPGDTGKPVAEANIASKTLIIIKISGTFAQTVMFYDRVLNEDRLIHMSKLEITSAAKGPINSASSVLLESNATFIAYSQQPKLIPASLPSPSAVPPGMQQSPPPLSQGKTIDPKNTVAEATLEPVERQ